MDLFALIKTYGEGQGKETMWKSVKHISDFVEMAKKEHPDEYSRLKKQVYADMQGGHFNEEFGSMQIDKMYYKDDAGVKHYAPFWTQDKMKEAYQKAKAVIPEPYTEWDFYVTLNMVKSDNQRLLQGWFPEKSEEQLMKCFVDLACNFLDDEDSPNPKTKIWSYFNGKV